jgi:hypothetical protein
MAIHWLSTAIHSLATYSHAFKGGDQAPNDPPRPPSQAAAGPRNTPPAYKLPLLYGQTPYHPLQYIPIHPSIEEYSKYGYRGG